MIDRVKWMLLLATVLLFVQGCNGGDGDGNEIDTDTHQFSVDGECAYDDRVGLFEISHHEIYSAVTGTVKNGVNPTEVLHPQESDGPCILLEKNYPQCTPACEPGYTCDTNGECIPFPATLDMGTITVMGLLSDLEIDPNSVGDYSDTAVEHPPFEDGSEISLVVPGGDGVDLFILDGYGMEVLETPGAEWIIERDETTLEVTDDLTINWTPSSGDARILATLNIDQHGNSPVTMRCLFDDTGAAVIPKDFLQIFNEYPVSGAGNGNLYRITYDSVQTANGCVELQVYSHVHEDLTAEHQDEAEPPP